MSNRNLSDPDDALKFCEELLSDLDDIPERGEDFANSIKEKVESMSVWIDENSAVTEKIRSALENMRRGVDRWLGR